MHEEMMNQTQQKTAQLLLCSFLLCLLRPSLTSKCSERKEKLLH